MAEAETEAGNKFAPEQLHNGIAECLSENASDANDAGDQNHSSSAQPVGENTSAEGRDKETNCHSSIENLLVLCRYLEDPSSSSIAELAEE